MNHSGSIFFQMWHMKHTC